MLVLSRVASPSDDPKLERRPLAAIRDILAGAALIGIGILTRATSLDGGDGIDYLFDALGIFWIGWGIFRLVRRA